MCRGVENYEGKEICILGGGDGALLYELLKENPKHVVMLEIDELVMQTCNKYLNVICGDVLEKRKGDQYEIIVGDCVEYLKKFIAEGRKFDYVFGDLTDIPITDAPEGETWDFIRTIFEHSFKVLKPDGKYLTHGNGSTCKVQLRLFEEQLNLLRPKVKFTTTKAFVPSFMEEWLFYQVTFAWQAQVDSSAAAVATSSAPPTASHTPASHSISQEPGTVGEMLQLHSYTVTIHGAAVGVQEEENMNNGAVGQLKPRPRRRKKKRVHYHHTLVS